MNVRLTRRQIVAGLALSGVGGTHASPAREAFPSKTITIVVPFGPGGSPDVYSRMLAKHLTERTGQTVIVENRPGANSMLGTGYVARSAPADGHTILYGTNSGLSAARSMVTTLAYNPTADLSGVSMIGETSFMLLGRAANLGNAGLAGLLQHMRDKPGKVSIGGASVTTTVVNRLMANAGKLDYAYVPYKENSRMLNELIAGELDAGFSPIPSAVQLIRSGKLVPLAVTGPQRVALFPQVPTIAEQLPGVTLTTWTGFFVPSKTPRPVVDYLHRQLGEIGEMHELKEFTSESGRPLKMTPAQIDDFVKRDEPRWQALFREAGIEPQ